MAAPATAAQLSHALPSPVASPSFWSKLLSFLGLAAPAAGPVGSPPLVFAVNKATPVYLAKDVGGKAHNCIRLNSMPSVVIPPCAVISCAEYDDALASRNLEALSEEARIILKACLKPDARYAVRSSADVEDSGDSAMAGQFITVLNVKGNIESIEAAVVECWKSARSEAVKDSGARMGVVVMEQIDSEKAGVLFMANPITKSIHSWVINSTWGQGEGVVGGTVPVDCVTLSSDAKHEIRKARIVKKTEMLVLAEGGHGTTKVAVPAEKQDVPCISQEEIALLIKTGMAIRKHSSCPQDVEFAFAGGQLYILQARPITTISAHLVWNPPEPGLFQLNGHMATPLSRFYQPVFVNGHPTGVLELSDDIGAGFTEINACIINGFAYFCLRNPGPRSAPKALPPPFVLRMIMRLTAGKAIKAATSFWTQKRYRKFASEEWPKRKQELLQLHASWLAKDLSKMTDADLASVLDEAQAYGTAMYHQHCAVTMNNLSPIGWFVIRAKQMTGCTSIEGFACVDGFSAPSLGLQGEFPEEIKTLAADEALCKIMTEGTKDPAATLEKMGKSDTAGAAALRKVLNIVQYRLADGYDCANGTLKEEPGLLLSSFAVAVDKVRKGTADEARIRGEAAAAALRVRVKPSDQAEFDSLLDDARFVASIRDERALYMDLTAMGIIHHILLKVGERLAARGGANVDSTLSLEAAKEELQEQLKGTQAPSPEWWAELAKRRHTRQTQNILEAPEALGGPVLSPTREYFPDEYLARSALSCIFAIDEIFKAPDFESDGQVQDDPDVIVGTPGAKGVTRGKVRVITTAHDAAQVLPGEIVVSKYSSSVINLILNTAGGIVTDLGGVLCHAAICAREAQLPCVVACHTATMRLHNGDEVEVDGAQGLVRILKRA